MRKACDSGEQFEILNKAVRVDLTEMTFKQTRKRRKSGRRTYQAKRTTSEKNPEGVACLGITEIARRSHGWSKVHQNESCREYVQRGNRGCMIGHCVNFGFSSE